MTTREGRTHNMDRDEVKKELLELINGNHAMVTNYLKIRDNYLLRLHCQYDEIRKEICKCIIHGLFQASITLTNHLLEKFMKTSLIYHFAGFKTIGENTFTDLEPYIEKFDKLDLGYNKQSMQRRNNYKRRKEST